jgi:hypothetical protein
MENTVAVNFSKPEFISLESSPTLGKFFEALAKAQGEILPAILDCRNPHYDSMYASLTSCQNSYRQPLSKNGFAVVQQVFSDEKSYYVRSLLGHASGEWMANTIRLIVDRQNMQGLGSAITYARRYGVNALVGVVDTEDDDGNAAVADDKQKQKVAQKTFPTKTNHQGTPPHRVSAAQLKNHAVPEPQRFPDEDVNQAMEQTEKQFALKQLKNTYESLCIHPDDVTAAIKKIVGAPKKSTELTVEEITRVIQSLKTKSDGQSALPLETEVVGEASLPQISN